jgi:hypothetical protein
MLDASKSSLAMQLILVKRLRTNIWHPTSFSAVSVRSVAKILSWLQPTFAKMSAKLIAVYIFLVLPMQAA